MLTKRLKIGASLTLLSGGRPLVRLRLKSAHGGHASFEIEGAKDVEFFFEGAERGDFFSSTKDSTDHEPRED